MGPRDGYVYCLMDTRNSICKIGMTGHKLNRIKSLKSGCSSPQDMVHEIIEVDDRVEAENYLHRLFCKKRLHGEWFKEVSFELWRAELLRYIDEKNKGARDSVSFYKFLYSTDYEIDHPIPITKIKQLEIPEYKIMIFLGKDFKSESVFRSKLDKILSNLPSQSKITLTCATKFTKDIVSNYAYGRFPRISAENFSNQYDKNAIYFTDMCIDTLRSCYGLVVFCYETNGLIERLIDYSQRNDIKARLIKIDQPVKKVIVRKLRVA